MPHIGSGSAQGQEREQEKIETSETHAWEQKADSQATGSLVVEFREGESEKQSTLCWMACGEGAADRWLGIEPPQALWPLSMHAGAEH